MLQQRRQVITWFDGIISDGLVARYQGSNNTGAGHSSTATVWKDLVGVADLTLSQGLRPGTRQWGANYFESLKVAQSYFVWRSSPLPSTFSPENATLEVVFMPYTGADASNGGDVVGIDNVPTAPYTTVTLEMSGMNGSYLFEESATFVTLNRRLLTANTLYSVSMPSTPYSPIPAQNGTKGIYYNGVRQYRASRTANLYVQLPQHTLSVSSNGALEDVRQVFYGRIYEVRIYNRALSESELAYNAAWDLMTYGT